jgi:hypothetical protein
MGHGSLDVLGFKFGPIERAFSSAFYRPPDLCFWPSAIFLAIGLGRYYGGHCRNSRQDNTLTPFVCPARRRSASSRCRASVSGEHFLLRMIPPENRFPLFRIMR